MVIATYENGLRFEGGTAVMGDVYTSPEKAKEMLDQQKNEGIETFKCAYADDMIIVDEENDTITIHDINYDDCCTLELVSKTLVD